MKSNLNKPKDPILAELVSKLNGILSNIDIFNFNAKLVKGATNPSANTEQIFNHSLGRTPQFYLPVSGDFYIKKMGNKTVDVRSLQANENFEFFLVG